MPEVNGAFPRPWDQVLARKHPSLSSVQYMPANSTVTTQPRRPPSATLSSYARAERAPFAADAWW
jgi:hypothetical protein